MIAIIDYGAGNIFSVKNALDYLGLPAALTADPEAIRNADALILPVVGAFPSAMQMLHDSGLTGVIREESRKKPFLGICLGMQLIFEKGYEFEECDGLGLVPGKVAWSFPIWDGISWKCSTTVPFSGICRRNPMCTSSTPIRQLCRTNIWPPMWNTARQRFRQWCMTERRSTAHSSIRKRAARSDCKFCGTSEG